MAPRTIRFAGERYRVLGGGGGSNPPVPPSGGGGGFNIDLDGAEKKLQVFMKKHPRFFPALTALGLGVTAAGQFGDGDPVAKNALEAAGSVGGGLAGQKIGAVLGGILGAPFGGPIGSAAGTFLGGAAGMALGSGAGADILGGIYNQVTGGSEGDKTRREYAKDVRLQNQLRLEGLTEAAPVLDQIAKMQDARSINMARQNAQIMQSYNFANSLNTEQLQRNQNEANALNILLSQYI